MSEIPWWGLPLVAAVFALVGAAVALIVTARNNYVRSRARKTRRWYEERKAAYVALMAAFERTFARLRATYVGGGKEPDPLGYLDEVGPALMQVRLLASGPVRSAALAVHLLLEQLHGGLKPASVPGVEPEKHVRELLVQVPLVMQQFEAAIRDELEIITTPPRPVEARIRSLGAQGAGRVDSHWVILAAVGQDRWVVPGDLSSHGIAAPDAVTATVIRSGVVAVLRAPSANAFAAVADVLVEAGITAIEVTLTSQGAVNAIAGLRRQLPAEVALGAGTILTADEAKASVDAGAAFLVSPVLDRGLARGFGVPFYPGALSPTEVFTAARDGAPLVKLFPASAVRPSYLKDLHGPLPGVRIMPTGGIGIGDVAGWLTAGASAVGLGGPLLGDAASGGSLVALADRARRAADAVVFARS